MTNKEAIKQLEELKFALSGTDDRVLNVMACDMAIAALKDARPKGKWIVDERMVFPKCSCCKVQGYNSFDFCPMCGADMREGAAE